MLVHTCIHQVRAAIMLFWRTYRKKLRCECSWASHAIELLCSQAETQEKRCCVSIRCRWSVPLYALRLMRFHSQRKTALRHERRAQNVAEGAIRDLRFVTLSAPVH